MNNKERDLASILWAKKSGNNGVFTWLPLKQHLRDCLNISGLLWEHWLCEGQKNNIIKSLYLDEAVDGNEDLCGDFDFNREHIAKKLVMFLAAVHDLGKATPAFQVKSSFGHTSRDLDEYLLDKLENAGLAGVKTLSLANPTKTPHALASQVILQKNGVNTDIANIVGGHHGKPSKLDQSVEVHWLAYPNNYHQGSKEDSIVSVKWSDTQKEILNWALAESGFKDKKCLPKISLPAQVILMALLIMADWIASNEEYFPLINIDDDGFAIDQKERIEEGFRKWFKTSKWEPSTCYDVNTLYRNHFNFEPRVIQRDFIEIIHDCKKPSIFILEAPMGIGKTEAALVAAEQLAAMTGRSGLFFGLPTQATSNGVFTRLKDWLNNICNTSKENKSLQLIHAKAALNDDFNDLKELSKIYSEDELITNQWFSGRKTRILDDFVVATVDHFLLLALKQKHLALRHLGLSRKVIIIDEVHAYDSYMSQYLYRAISWMGVLEVPVIILSATLPGDKRQQLLEAYIRGQGKKIRHISGLGTELKKCQAYPLISYLDGNEVKRSVSETTQKQVVVEIKKLENEDFLYVLDACLASGGVVGIIVNTVNRAQRLAEKLISLYAKDEIEVLHSSFIASDRIEKEKNLLASIGKKAKRPERRIIVGTQVIEQSLDIDFDVLFSDLAPMDLLIQRIGRLHRHERLDRVKAHLKPVCYVMGASPVFDFEKGSTFVYGAYLLMRTQMYLPPFIELPKDISPLVQRVYMPDEELDREEKIADLDPELRRAYDEAKKSMERNIKTKEERARAFLLEKPNRKANLQNWSQNDVTVSSDEQANAQVRDIEDSIEVILVKKCGDGYSFWQEDSDISRRISETSISKKLATQTIRLPAVLSKGYIIDKSIAELESFNSKYLANWQENAGLKGSLGIILDENNSFELNGWTLRYSSEYGISMEKI